MGSCPQPESKTIPNCGNLCILKCTSRAWTNFGPMPGDRPMTISTPILPVLDLELAKDFYRQMGFSIVDYDDYYAIVVCEDYEIAHLQVRGELETTASLSSIYLNVMDADSWHARLTDNEIDVGLIADQEWGMREFAVSDPFGNQIRIGTAL